MNLGTAPHEKQHIPAVGRLVTSRTLTHLRARYPHELIVEAVRQQLADERARGMLDETTRLNAIEGLLSSWTRARVRPVINGTGIILHTNLGRAPLSSNAVDAAVRVAGRYANVEFDLASGRRGDRHLPLGHLLNRLTGAEASIVVNNNAAAVLLMLTALARGREVIVSRGELVEIGGSFRMPDIMRLSGARMVEVGTTNRTRVADYESAVTPRTAALLRVHSSNFRVVGFTESAAVADLKRLASLNGLPILYDLGSGALRPLSDEPLIGDAVAHADVVTFSADKLLGGPQAGIAVGRRDLIEKMRRHPLARVLRVDKMTIAAMEATLIDWLTEQPNPVWTMCSATPEWVGERAATVQRALEAAGVRCQAITGSSMVGGGSLPADELPTTLLALPGPAAPLGAALRGGDPAVAPRLVKGRCCIDLRTVLPQEDEDLIRAVIAVARSREATKTT